MPEDYKKLGLKSGIEIHQQLDTHKLFCECKSLLRKDEPDFEISRRLHAVAGEGGEVDIAARHEAEKEREFLYQGYDTTCLVELDEEPPHMINQEALEICLHIALLLNCEILPVSQIMRKTVIDGSNTSGFQRTVLIARDGWVETEHGRVGIDNVNLEEDAARIVRREQERVVFRLDRLGIPLVEIGTAPDIKSPEQAKEVALKLGGILRACRVKRGLGTIRQDINISIKGHPRVEIKGFQEPKLFVKTVEKEVERQSGNIKNKNLKAEVRKAEADGGTLFLRLMSGAARMYPETDLPLLRISKQMIDKAKKTLPKLKQEEREELRKKGLSEEMINLVLQKGLAEFEALLPVYNKPNFVAKAVFLFPSEIRKKYGKKADKLTLDIIESILEKVADGKISERDVKKVMIAIAEGESFDEAVKIKKVDMREVEQFIVRLLKEKPGLSEKAYMGLVMKEYGGRVGGGDVMEILKRILK